VREGEDEVNAKELFHSDGRSAGVWHCDKCGIIHRLESAAESCCQINKCEDCGKDCERTYYTICKDCERKKIDENKRLQFEKAKHVPESEWNDRVYDGNDYYDSVEEMREMRESNGDEILEYVWACETRPLVNIDVSDATQCIEDRAYDDFEFEDLHGIKDLEKALDAFNEANKDFLLFTPDFSTAIVLHKLN